MRVGCHLLLALAILGPTVYASVLSSHGLRERSLTGDETAHVHAKLAAWSSTIEKPLTKPSQVGYYACNDTGLIPFGNCNNISCHFCINETVPGGPYSAQVNCTDHVSGKVGSYESDNNITRTLIAAIGELSLKFNATFTSADCGCTCQPENQPLFYGCSLRTCECIYVNPALVASGDNFTVQERGVLWDIKHPDIPGLSKGWLNISDGYAPSDAYTIFRDGVQDLRRKLPGGDCAATSLPPMVLVPGLTSSSLDYKLTDSPPPFGEFWCNKSTDGFQPLWPAPEYLITEPAQTSCWAADMGVEFDPSTQTFRPKRDGQETRLVDFGSFSGIPGFGGALPLFEAAGWTLEVDLFAAPFDWRVPSAGQDEFYTKLKALVEMVSARNDNKKVALWAFSFGPQYALSFLHRMTQAWKDQYIHTFVATSPVWSGAPEALVTFVSGYGRQPPPKPKECKAFTFYEGQCYSGPILDSIPNTDLSSCCTAANADNMTQHIFNWFADNKTCNLVAKYISAEPCPTGMLAYVNSQHSVAEGAQQLGDVPLTPSLTRLVARASPSIMWAFPRSGSNASISWTKNEPIIFTPNKNYTAFDMPALLKDLEMSETEQKQLSFLETESDLYEFRSPGVDTFVTYGVDLPTMATAHYAKDLSRAPPPSPEKNDYEDGDGLVPKRSCTRGLNASWAEEQKAAGKALYYKGYTKQPHANCFLFGVPGVVECWLDVMQLFQKNIPPSV